MQVLHQLPYTKDKDLLVGIETADDAGVYKLSDEMAVVSTLDFFPPIVDDPFLFGQIAAANSLSDIYAMGATPRLAMNIVCFPKELGLEVLGEIMRGSLDKLNEASALLIGGHSVEDTEVKYGLSVTGFVHPDKVITNRGARPGDVLVLTKPVGVGVITSALKAGRIDINDAEEAFESMRTLNKAASEVMVEVGVNACTDVTGYGVLGHAMEMAKGSEANLVIDTKDIKIFPQALGLINKKSNRPRTLMDNRDYVMKDVMKAVQIDEALELMLFDPQTSGGLLISVPEQRSEALLSGLRKRFVNPSIIGRVVEKEGEWRIRLE